MRTKEEIVQNWLTRYTGLPLDKFGEYILLTNFRYYVDLFAQLHQVSIVGEDKEMLNATADNITIIDFSIGSPMAATVMDLLSAINPQAVLFLGKCGGIKPYNKLGDFILPLAAVRGEGTSNDYFRPKYRRCPHLVCKKRPQAVFGIWGRIIGREPFTPPIGGCGNMTRNLKNICVKFASWA